MKARLHRIPLYWITIGIVFGIGYETKPERMVMPFPNMPIPRWAFYGIGGLVVIWIIVWAIFLR